MLEPYTVRLARALGDKVGRDVEVYVDTHLVTFVRHQVAATTTVPHAIDRRHPVADDDVAQMVRLAATRLAGNVRHYRPEHVAPAQELVTILRESVS